MSPIQSLLCAALVAVPLCTAVAAESAYPNRPIRIVDPFPPGGPSDIVNRAINQRLSEALGQSVVIDNRAGAGGIVGCELVARATPDGYTLLLGPSGALTIAPTLNPKLRYDPQRDFVPVTQLTSGPQVISVHPGVAAKSVQELIALAKAKPGQLNYASGGAGTANHIAVEYFKLVAGINVVHLPYKGTGPALTAVLAGEAQMIISALLAALPHVKSGKLRALAVTSMSRSAGTANHIAVEYFKLVAGINVVHLPYKGTGPALTAVLAGEAQMIISALLAALPHVKSGKLRALAVTSASRSAATPEIPTAAESGLPKFETSSWHGILVPAKTPRTVVVHLHSTLVKVLNTPDVRERLTVQGLNIVASTPQEFDAHIKSETAKYARVIKHVGIKPET